MTNETREEDKIRNKSIFEIIAKPYPAPLMYRDLQILSSKYNYSLDDINKSLRVLDKAKYITLSIEDNSVVSITATQTGLERINKKANITEQGKKIVEAVKKYQSKDIRGVHRHYIAKVLDMHYSKSQEKYDTFMEELSILIRDKYINVECGWLKCND